MKYIISLLLLFLFLFPLRGFTQPTGRLAINVTQAEVEMWKNWIRNGPSSKQNQWSTILGYANGSASNRWSGNPSNTCPNSGIDPSNVPSRTQDRVLTTAGFVYIVTKGTTDIVPNPVTYRTKVRDALIAQSNITGSDFSNTSRWCPAKSAAADQHEIATWLRRIAYAYDYIRADISAGDRTTLDQWFLDAGEYFDGGIQHWASQRFSGRLNDNYTCDGGYCPGTTQGILYFGGPQSYSFSAPWSNTYSTFAGAVAAVGIVVEDVTLKSRAKRWFQEWVRYAVFPGGQVWDQYRWHTGSTSRAYFYPMTNLGTTITIADNFARAGDTSLYEYATSEGYAPANTSDGSTVKSLLKAMLLYARYTNGTLIHYASNSSTSNPDLIIDELSGNPSNSRIDWVNLTPANVYMQLDDTPTSGEKTELETAVDTALPGSWTCGGYDCLMGDWGTYPHIQFMFKDSTVDPYTGQIVSLTPSLNKCWVSQSQPNKVLCAFNDPNGGTFTGSTGFTAELNTVSNTITNVSVGTTYMGVKGVTLTLTNPVTSPDDDVTISYSSGDVSDGTSSLDDATDFPVTNYFGLLFDPEQVSSVSCQDSGRLISTMLTVGGSDSQSWVCSTTNTMTAVLDLGASKEVTNIIWEGDNTGQIHCGTFDLDKDDTCSASWTNVLNDVNCLSNVVTETPLTPDTSRCWRIVVTGDNANGAQLFSLNGTMTGGDPPDPPISEPSNIHISITGGINLSGGVSIN